MRPNGGFEKLFRDRTFNQHLISIVIDEAHCISQWGSFRSEYRDIGRIRFLQRKPCPILATSATMSPAVIEDVKKVLHLRTESLFISQCSTDRPNISIVVRPILNPIRSFRDLSFLLRNWKLGSPPPPKFIVFFDNINTSIQAALFLRSLLPHEYQQRVKWFNSEMSDTFKRDEAARFACGETWGLMATDSFGMVGESFLYWFYILIPYRVWISPIYPSLSNGVPQHPYPCFGNVLVDVFVILGFKVQLYCSSKGSMSKNCMLPRSENGTSFQSKLSRAPHLLQSDLEL